MVSKSSEIAAAQIFAGPTPFRHPHQYWQTPEDEDKASCNN